MFWIRPKTGFLTHNFGYRYASKSIKGSIEADFDLVFNKTLSQKNGSTGLGPRPAKGGQFSKACLLCDVTSRKTPTENKKRFFFDFVYKTCWIRRGFEQLSSSIAWRVIGLQSSAKKRSHTGIKGLSVWTSDRLFNEANRYLYIQSNAPCVNWSTSIWDILKPYVKFYLIYCVRPLPYWFWAMLTMIWLHNACNNFTKCILLVKSLLYDWMVTFLNICLDQCFPTFSRHRFFDTSINYCRLKVEFEDNTNTSYRNFDSLPTFTNFNENCCIRVW